jgi:hypothetical protein
MNIINKPDEVYRVVLYFKYAKDEREDQIINPATFSKWTLDNGYINQYAKYVIEQTLKGLEEKERSLVRIRYEIKKETELTLVYPRVRSVFNDSDQ